jgi:hypothetical protein
VAAIQPAAAFSSSLAIGFGTSRKRFFVANPGQLAKWTASAQHGTGADMNRLQTSPDIHVMHWALAMMVFIALALSRTQAQSAVAPSAAQSAQSQTASPPAAPATPGDDLAQMRTDLDRMESLLGNMSSEIEFLRDQNLQILLRTNAQMWTMLIRDLRRQVDREERARHPTH